MGKKLIVDYTFDASAKTITIQDIFSLERFQLITNVTDNVVIMQFNDPAFGITDISFDYANSTTTITLAYDTTSMSDTDSLQIFLDEGSTDITVNERFIDPVSKIRVSNPENLIDTDFEYGLQSTKWETLELTANIPTFFSRSGDFDIALTSMQTQNGSDIVVVTTDIDHQLQRGSPIIIQGSGNVSADGGFVVNSVLDDTSFTYKAKSIIQSTSDIKEQFTILNSELTRYNPELLDKNFMIGISKTDLLDEELYTAIEAECKAAFDDIPFVLFSSVTQQGIPELKDTLWHLLNA